MTREERKKAMPQCSAFIDQMRRVFGEPAYIKASENGHEVEWGNNPLAGGMEITPSLPIKRKAKADAAGKVREPQERLFVHSTST